MEPGFAARPGRGLKAPIRRFKQSKCSRFSRRSLASAAVSLRAPDIPPPSRLLLRGRSAPCGRLAGRLPPPRLRVVRSARPRCPPAPAVARAAAGARCGTGRAAQSGGGSGGAGERGGPAGRGPVPGAGAAECVHVAKAEPAPPTLRLGRARERGARRAALPAVTRTRTAGGGAPPPAPSAAAAARPGAVVMLGSGEPFRKVTAGGGQRSWPAAAGSGAGRVRLHRRGSPVAGGAAMSRCGRGALPALLSERPRAGAAAAPEGSLAGFQPGAAGCGNGGRPGRGLCRRRGCGRGAGASVPGRPAASPRSLPGGTEQDGEGREKGGSGRTESLGKGEVCGHVKELLR